MLKKEILEQDKETMELEYELICILETRKKTPQITTLIKLLKPFGYTIGIKKIEKDSKNE